MKLPADAIIAREKLTRYLLVRQARGDKSAFLAQAGYRIGNPDRFSTICARNYCRLIPPLHSTEFGEFYEIRGKLTGPNGVTLRVCSIWMQERLSQATKFITLIPEK